jgi:CheY-like chemotaxis protein
VPRALIIDDAADIRLLERHALERAGLEVCEANGGPAAISTCAGGVAPDVIVLDVQMPDLDGWDTLAEFRRLRGTAATPVILCTVKGGPEDELRAWELGADGYITKPFVVAAFVAEVQRVLARGDVERQRLRHARRVAALRKCNRA